MKYCKRCLQPDSRPSVKFSDNGICFACIHEEERKTKIDWNEREKELREIADEAKELTSCGYDCVIGVSGGKDSHFQAIYAKDKLGLTPLLVCNEPDGRTAVGTHNIENLRSYGFDLVEIRPDPEVMRALTKRDFYKYGNLVKSSEYSLWSSAYRVAVEKEIPLVIQGENPAETLGIVGDGIDGGDALSIVNHNTLQGDLEINEEEAKLYNCRPVTSRQLHMFRFPSKEELRGIRGVFLSHYAKEWGQNHNTRFARQHGLKGRYDEKLEDIGRTARETSVDGDFLLVNQYIKYLKFGFGFETDTQCYNIRELGDSREEAIKYVEMYDGSIGKQYIEQFCEYIGISYGEFWRVVKGFVNNDLFEPVYNEGNVWIPKFRPKFKVGHSIEHKAGEMVYTKSKENLERVFSMKRTFTL